MRSSYSIRRPSGDARRSSLKSPTVNGTKRLMACCYVAIFSPTSTTRKLLINGHVFTFRSPDPREGAWPPQPLMVNFFFQCMPPRQNPGSGHVPRRIFLRTRLVSSPIMPFHSPVAVLPPYLPSRTVCSRLAAVLAVADSLQPSCRRT